MARQATIRFSEEMYQRLDLASSSTGLPINSIVVVACMEWLQRHRPELAYRRSMPNRGAEHAARQDNDADAVPAAVEAGDNSELQAMVVEAVRRELANRENR